MHVLAIMTDDRYIIRVKQIYESCIGFIYDLFYMEIHPYTNKKLDFFIWLGFPIFSKMLTCI